LGDTATNGNQLIVLSDTQLDKSFYYSRQLLQRFCLLVCGDADSAAFTNFATETVVKQLGYAFVYNDDAAIKVKLRSERIRPELNFVSTGARHNREI
jgi:hypothetical protein